MYGKDEAWALLWNGVMKKSLVVEEVLPDGRHVGDCSQSCPAEVSVAEF